MTNILAFDDIFHELYADLDSESNEWPYLNNFYLNFMEDELENQEELNRSNASQWQQHQQQNQSQIVVSTSEKSVTKIGDAHYRFFHDIPDYLLPSSSSFRTAFFAELNSFRNSTHFQDLQELNILTHQTSIIYLHQQLWHGFLQAGTGQLKRQVQDLLQESTDEVSTSLSFWPQAVTSVMICQGIIQPAVDGQYKIDQETYINFVQSYLRQLEKQAKQRRLQFDTIVNRLPGYTYDVLNDRIEHYLRNEDTLTALRVHFERRIALLEYIRIDRSYQLAYFQQKPTDLLV